MASDASSTGAMGAAPAPVSNGSSYGTNDHNLNAGVSGTGNITGTPNFLGGSNPTTYAGFRLSSGSPGRGAASDGTDMGVS